MLPVADKLNKLLGPVVEGLGYVYWGAMLGQTESGHTLRVFIDQADGIDVDDCAKVSRQLSAMLDVEDPISGAYVLEVSSPGADRPLFTAEQFAEVVGSEIRLRSRLAVLGRRNFRGLLCELLQEDAEQVLRIEVDQASYEVPLADVEKANLVPDYG